ncbi:MAG: methionyl-tRNA formyltransferase [Ruminococcus sp.]|nr:methionyl-tRNA formyltransferase [Candidatus Apopatosoma intestinale]
MRIVFMGTPDFAAVALRALAESAYGKDVVGVVTQADKPKNRGHVLTPPPVKVLAETFGYPVYQPQSLKAEFFGETYRELAPDLVIVAAYGKILPGYVLDAPRYGCVNIHGSLLPKYRGAAPIQRAIMAGETELGITLMYMEAGLDTGDMLAKGSIALSGDESFGEIHDRLAAIGAELLVTCLPKLIAGELRPEKQDDALSTYAPKIEKEDLHLDFSRPARELHNTVRALSPAPGAYAILNGSPVKITKTALTGKPAAANPGTCPALNAKGEGAISVSCGDEELLILRLIPEGKKEMSAGDFIRGRKIVCGQIWE